jgi:hypothetical protein
VRVADTLGRLDRLVLPHLARGLGRLAGVRSLRGGVLVAVLTAAGLATWAATHRPAVPEPVIPTVRVGIAPGDSVDAYAAASRAELARLSGEPESAIGTSAPGGAGRPIYALVSLRTYLAPARVAAILSGASAVTLDLGYATVPWPGPQTEVVRLPVTQGPADLNQAIDQAMDQVASSKLDEADDYEQLAAALPTDSTTLRQLGSLYAGRAALARVEAEAYATRCSCVYALVVRATPVALARLWQRPEVRIIDPAPEVSSLDQAVFVAPRPPPSGVAAPAGTSPGALVAPPPAAATAPTVDTSAPAATAAPAATSAPVPANVAPGSGTSRDGLPTDPAAGPVAAADLGWAGTDQLRLVPGSW